MTKFNHVSVKLPELKTVTVDRKRFYVTPEEKYYPSITTVLSSQEIRIEDLKRLSLMLQIMYRVKQLQEELKFTICVRII